MLKEKTYTIPEFLEMQRAGERIDKLGYRVKKHINKAIATGIGATMFLVNHPALAFADGSGLEEIDKLGFMFLTIVRRVGYWLALICAIVELIKCMREGGNKQDIGQIIMKYILIYAALFLIPKAFDIITGALS